MAPEVLVAAERLACARIVRLLSLAVVEGRVIQPAGMSEVATCLSEAIQTFYLPDPTSSTAALLPFYARLAIDRNLLEAYPLAVVAAHRFETSDRVPLPSIKELEARGRLRQAALRRSSLPPALQQTPPVKYHPPAEGLERLKLMLEIIEAVTDESGSLAVERFGLMISSEPDRSATVDVIRLGIEPGAVLCIDLVAPRDAPLIWLKLDDHTRVPATRQGNDLKYRFQLDGRVLPSDWSGPSSLPPAVLWAVDWEIGAIS